MSAVGERVERWGTLPSTNARALELAREGAEHGWVVVADAQSSGRGQRGASWHSPPGSGLYASYLLRPKIDAAHAPFLGLAAGVAVASAVRPWVGEAVGLKWPNDLLAREPPFEGRKLAGILVESAIDADGLRHAVVGIGMNLRGAPEEIEPRAVSLEGLGVPPPETEVLLSALSKSLGDVLSVLELRDAEQVIRAWNARALRLGAWVRVEAEGRRSEGVFRGLDADGAVVLEAKDGSRRSHAHGRIELWPRS